MKYLHIADENAELTRYRAGELARHQCRAAQPIRVDQGRISPAELHVAPQLNTYYYGFNLDRAPFKGNAPLRRALSLVIDREKLAQLVLRVGELPAYGWVPPGMHDYTPQTFDYAHTPMPQRIAEAQRLYAQAGYSARQTLRFELRYNPGEVHDRLAVAIASMWKEALGVEARLTAVEFKSLLQDIDRGDVEMFRSSWVGRLQRRLHVRPVSEERLRHQPAALPAIPNTTLLLARPRPKWTRASGASCSKQAERRMLADHPLMPLYFYVNKHLVKPQVQGWYDNVMNVVYSKDLSLALTQATLA